MKNALTLEHHLNNNRISSKLQETSTHANDRRIYSTLVPLLYTRYYFSCPSSPLL